MPQISEDRFDKLYDRYAENLTNYSKNETSNKKLKTSDGYEFYLYKNKLKYFATHIMNDESVLFGLGQSSNELKLSAYWLCGVGILFAWPIGVLSGYILGSHLAYAKLLGIDTIFPVVLFALTFKALKRKSARKSAMTGAVISLATFPFLPLGIPILMSLFGLLVGRK